MKKSLTAENRAKYLKTHIKTEAAIFDERLGQCLHGYAAVYLSMLAIFKHTNCAAMQVLRVKPIHFCIYRLTRSR